MSVLSLLKQQERMGLKKINFPIYLQQIEGQGGECQGMGEQPRAGVSLGLAAGQQSLLPSSEAVGKTSREIRGRSCRCASGKPMERAGLWARGGESVRGQGTGAGGEPGG